MKEYTEAINRAFVDISAMQAAVVQVLVRHGLTTLDELVEMRDDARKQVETGARKRVMPVTVEEVKRMFGQTE